MIARRSCPSERGDRVSAREHNGEAPVEVTRVPRVRERRARLRGHHWRRACIGFACRFDAGVPMDIHWSCRRIAQYLIGRGYNLHTIYDEISILEGDDRRPEYGVDRRGLDWVDLLKSYVFE